MACALTSNLTLDCRDSIGGIKRFYVSEWASGTTWTVTTGTVTAVSGNGTFRKYEQEEETGLFEEQWQASRENGTLFFEQDATMIFYKGQATTRNELLLVAKNRLFIIARDNNDKYWLMGRQSGAMLEPSKFTTGTAKGDRPGYELKFKAKELAPAEELSASVVTTLGLT